MNSKNGSAKKKAVKERIRSLLKLFFFVEYQEDGRFNVLFRFPIAFNVRWVYRLLYANKPIQQNKIVFDNYMGKGYGCNPKYVVQELLEKHPGEFDLVWAVSEDDYVKGMFPPGVRSVIYESAEAKKEFATAKMWVSNYHKIVFVKKGMYKRPGQRFIQMWHGSLGIKRIENDVPGLVVDPNWLSFAKQSSEMVDYWISNSSFETEIYKRAFWNVRQVLEYGHPRNDLLLSPQRMSEVRDKVSRQFGILNKKILLYAPTFREDYRLDCYGLDYTALQESLQKRFGGEWVFLVRLHPRVRKYSNMIIPKNSSVMDVTYYDDIQELIACADCMITDYSSCVFDFMLTKRPAFIYATDIDEFNHERGFYYPLDATPFPIATDNRGLLDRIEQFDAGRYEKDVDAFLKEKGCIEDGHASERIAQLIAEIMGHKD